jgi:lactoylglutathione lyase
MPITAVRAASVYVTDQQKALDFYTKTLGFSVKARTPVGPGQLELVEVVPPGGNTGLLLQTKVGGPKPSGTNLVLRTTDTIMTHQELKAKGVKFTQEPVTQSFGYVVAQFEDPDGNGFGLTNQPF